MHGLLNLKNPFYVRIDIATACQLRCPSCPTATGEIKKNLGTGFMPSAVFSQLLDANAKIRDVELSNWGEILLNPELPDILRYAHSRKLRLHADNGVNLNHASDEVLEAMVKYRLYSMTCSIDGSSNETYATYRKNGNLENVLQNIRKINAYKAAYKSRFPLLTWQFIVFAHNQHEISAARKMAKSLGMHFYLKLSWDDQYTEAFSPVTDKEHVKKEFGLGVANRQEYEEKYNRSYLQREICSQLWNSPQLNWDGRVLGCCVNYWGDFGNALKEGLPQALSNKSISYARRMLLGEVPAAEGIPCTTCTHYLKIQQNRQWLTRRFILRNRFYWWVVLHTVGNPKLILNKILQIQHIGNVIGSAFSSSSHFAFIRSFRKK